MHLHETAYRLALCKFPAEGMASSLHKVAFPGGLSVTHPAPASHRRFYHRKLRPEACQPIESPTLMKVLWVLWKENSMEVTVGVPYCPLWHCYSQGGPHLRVTVQQWDKYRFEREHLELLRATWPHKFMSLESNKKMGLEFCVYCFLLHFKFFLLHFTKYKAVADWK